MFAVALNYLLSLVLVLVVFALAWGASRVAGAKTRGGSGDTSWSLVFPAAAAFLLVAGIGRVGMNQPWTRDSVAAGLDQGAFLVLTAVGAFLLVLGYFTRRLPR